MYYSTKKTIGLACIATICLASVVSAAPADENAIVDSMVDNRAEMVKNAFKHAWKGYSEFAYGHDELQPMTNGTTDSR
jgi:mannosyl-oligosaccharide alpha-1,2-mannosidase